MLSLNVGAENYITKPFNPLELIARVKSALRRYTKLGSIADASQNIYISGGLVVDDEKKGSEGLYIRLLSAGIRGYDQALFVIYDIAYYNFPKYVLSLDEFDMSSDGIKHRNIRDFLTATECIYSH